jgi:hypothetical protein
MHRGSFFRLMAEARGSHAAFWVDQRKPLTSLLAFVGQVIDVTGRRQEFDQAPCLHLVVGSNTGQATLHIRIYPGTSQANRVIELGIYDALSREHRWTVRMEYLFLYSPSHVQ